MEREIYRLSKEHVPNQWHFVTVNIECFALSNGSVADFQRRLSFFNKRNYYSTWMSELSAFPRSQQLGIRVVTSGQAFFFHALKSRGSSSLNIEIQHETPMWCPRVDVEGLHELLPCHTCLQIPETQSIWGFFLLLFFFFSWTDKLSSLRAPLLSCE